jgi:hypothetical protein
MYMILILELFNYADLAAEDVWRRLRWEDENQWRQATRLRLFRREKSAVAYFKIVFRQLPSYRYAEKITKNVKPRSGRLLIQLRFEPGTS